jgi:hypothetical protein
MTFNNISEATKAADTLAQRIGDAVVVFTSRTNRKPTVARAALLFAAHGATILYRTAQSGN